MVEREPQLRTLAPYLTEAAGGHGRLVFVGGEAGGGKSTFVRSFVAGAGAVSARDRGRALGRRGDPRPAAPSRPPHSHLPRAGPRHLPPGGPARGPRPAPRHGRGGDGCRGAAPGPLPASTSPSEARTPTS